jgi:small subunit ribosomal protein S19e
MVSVYDVPAEKLIFAVAEDLEKNKKVKAPDYVNFVKTGVSKERAPDQENWYYIRMAAILRKFYTHKELGIEMLRNYFGSLKNRGVKRHHFFKASGKIIRDCVNDLEKLKFLVKSEKGRKITMEGRKYIDGFAKKVFDELNKKQ